MTLDFFFKAHLEMADFTLLLVSASLLFGVHPFGQALPMDVLGSPCASAGRQQSIADLSSLQANSAVRELGLVAFDLFEGVVRTNWLQHFDIINN